MKLAEKIQRVRIALAETKIKMSGENKFANYQYMELDDFIKPLNKFMLENKMTAIPSFNSEFATLTAYDFESEETISITSPFASAALKGCHEVQNIGAVETYQRRYLYQAMFDIAESDVLNKTHNQNNDIKKPTKFYCECGCGAEITAANGMTAEEVANYTKNKYGKKLAAKCAARVAQEGKKDE